VVSVGEYLKVLGAVVASILVDVVNVFIRAQQPADRLLCD